MKTISRRSFAHAIVVAGTSIALGACNAAAPKTTESSEGSELVAELEEPDPDEPVETESEEPDPDEPEATPTREDLIPESTEPVEATFFTDEEIAQIVEELHCDMTRDYKLELECNEAAGRQAMFFLHAYHTNLETLQITGLVPRYKYRNGKFKDEYPDDGKFQYMFLFDGDDIVYIMCKNDPDLVERYAPDMHPFSADYMYHRTKKRSWDGVERDYYSLGDAYAESTTKKGALIDAADGLYFYDGVQVWWIGSDGTSYEFMFDYLDEDPSSMPGLEDIELTDLLERQTFAYESPLLDLQIGNKYETDIPLDDFVDTFLSML